MSQGKAFTPQQREMIIQSIIPYLEMGFSRNKACSLIGLPPQTLSNWVVADEALGIKLQSAENTLNALAISNIASAMQKEAEMDDNRKDTSKWWLERKMRDDFATKTETKEEADVNITYKWADGTDNNDTLQTEEVGA